MFSYNHEKDIIQRSELHVSLLWYTMRFLIEILFRVRDLNKYPDTLIYWTKKIQADTHICIFIFCFNAVEKDSRLYCLCKSYYRLYWYEYSVYYIYRCIQHEHLNKFHIYRNKHRTSPNRYSAPSTRTSATN